MSKYSSEQLVRMALINDKRCLCKDYGNLFLVAWVWTREDIEDNDPKFESRLKKWFKFLLGHKHPDTIRRDKDFLLEKGAFEKSEAQSCKDLVNEIKGQTTFIKQEEVKEIKKQSSEYYEAQRKKLKDARDLTRINR